MNDASRENDEIELIGTLRWNEFEGGFWSLDIDAEGDADAPFDGRVVLGNGPLPGPAGPPTDGARVLVRGRAREGMLDFFMAGTPFEATSIEPMPGV